MLKSQLHFFVNSVLFKFSCNLSTFLKYLLYIWIGLFVIAPIAIMIYVSFAKPMLGVPPYSHIVSATTSGISINISFENYKFILFDEQFLESYLNSLILAAYSAFLCLIIGFMFAYSVSVAFSEKYKFILIIFAILPSWMSLAVRIYSWIEFLRPAGGLEYFCRCFKNDASINLIGTNIAMMIGMVHSYLPFMIIPLFSVIDKIPKQLLESAQDLGSRPINTFLKIVVPLAKSGIITGSILVFIPAFGEFMIPSFLGDGSISTVGQLIRDELIMNRDWPLACSMAFVILIFMLPFFVLLKRNKV